MWSSFLELKLLELKLQVMGNNLAVLLYSETLSYGKTQPTYAIQWDLSLLFLCAFGNTIKTFILIYTFYGEHLLDLFT